MEEGIYKATFVDLDCLGLQYGHVYQIEIIKQKYTYLIVVSQDMTEGKTCDIYYPMSSAISINNSWHIHERIM